MLLKQIGIFKTGAHLIKLASQRYIKLLILIFIMTVLYFISLGKTSTDGYLSILFSAE